MSARERRGWDGGRRRRRRALHPGHVTMTVPFEYAWRLIECTFRSLHALHVNCSSNRSVLDFGFCCADGVGSSSGAEEARERPMRAQAARVAGGGATRAHSRRHAPSRHALDSSSASSAWRAGPTAISRE